MDQEKIGRFIAETRNQAGETGKWDRNYIWNVIRESAEI